MRERAYYFAFWFRFSFAEERTGEAHSLERHET
jgi:hypothetical protein